MLEDTIADSFFLIFLCNLSDIFSTPLNQLNTHYKKHFIKIREYQLSKIQSYVFVKTSRLKFHVFPNPFDYY